MPTFSSKLFSIVEKATTPILVAVVGFILNLNINKTQSEISKLQAEMDLQIAPVKAMEPYMDMLSDTSETKNILGAYTIYMLKKNDSRIAAQMIASMQKDYLVDILRILGKDDDSVQAVLDELASNNYDLTALEYAQFDESTKDTLNLTSMQRYALEVKGSIEQNLIRNKEFEGSSDLTDLDDVNDNESIIMNNVPDGWIYLGEGRSLIVDLPKGEELRKSVYKLNTSTNLRADYPNKNNGYRLASKIRVIPQGSEVKVDSIFKEKKHYWGQVTIILKVKNLAENLFSYDRETRTAAARDIVLNAKDYSLLIDAVINQAEICLNESESDNYDCVNGWYNTGVVLNDLKKDLLKSKLKPDKIENILNQLPKGSGKTKAMFENILRTLKTD